MWKVNEDAESAYVQGINQQRHHCRRITSSFSSPITRTMESTREWKDQKLYTAMEIRHLVVPSLSSSRSLAETRATLEGEKMWTLESSRGRSYSFLLTFTTPRIFRNPPYTADVVSDSDKMLFFLNLYRALRHGGHAETHFT